MTSPQKVNTCPQIVHFNQYNPNTSLLTKYWKHEQNKENCKSLNILFGSYSFLEYLPYCSASDFKDFPLKYPITLIGYPSYSSLSSIEYPSYSSRFSIVLSTRFGRISIYMSKMNDFYPFPLVQAKMWDKYDFTKYNSYRHIVQSLIPEQNRLYNKRSKEIIARVKKSDLKKRLPPSVILLIAGYAEIPQIPDFYS